MIYDVKNITEDDCKAAIKKQFYERADIKDPRVALHLVNIGYYELEETCLQHKQKHQLYALLEGQRPEIPFLSKRQLEPRTHLTSGLNNKEENPTKWIE